mgnify:FL=1|tara:strand:- start:251 stop:469 length:219 start_codon:yes stop_codon:yes gene_type:complete
MKTFTSSRVSSNNPNLTVIYIVEADPKREGFYKMGEIQVVKGKKKVNRFSLYYGKSNQAKILELTKDMIEVN